MRVQKSVYHMTDRELRLYKRQLRRRMQMQRRILTMIATVCVIIFCAVSYQGIAYLGYDLEPEAYAQIQQKIMCYDLIQ